MYKLIGVTIILTIALGISTSSESRLKRSINGFRIKIIDVPYHVRILKDNVVTRREGSCSGSIISNDFVLTVAHCVCEAKPVPKRKIDPMYIQSGDDYHPNMTKNDEILNVICHPSYEFEENMSINDIALIQMKTSFNFSVVQYPVPINALPIFEIHIGRTVFSTGWGAIDSEAEKYDDYLRGVETEIISIEPCWEALKDIEYSNKNNVYNGFFCTKPINGGYPCKGDSGGPAIIKGVQVGIIAWGNDKSKERPCEYRDDWAIGFIDIAYYLPWILNYTTPLSIKLVL